MPASGSGDGPQSVGEELRDRNAAWYATLLGAFVSSRREKDKSLLALSTAGIGLPVTLATTIGIPSVWIALLYAFALAAFLVAIFAAIRLFDLDASHVEALLRELRKAPAKKLRATDRLLFLSFAVGVVLSRSVPRMRLPGSIALRRRPA